MTSASFAELDALPTEELRERAFAKAREHRDLRFFWSIVKHLPEIDEAVALWRELTGHGYGEQEPLLRAAFIDYLQKH